MEQQDITRILYLGTNEDAVTHAVPLLRRGANRVSACEADVLIDELRRSMTGYPSDRIKRQTARRLWDLFHDPYDSAPTWLASEAKAALERNQGAA